MRGADVHDAAGSCGSRIAPAQCPRLDLNQYWMASQTIASAVGLRGRVSPVGPDGAGPRRESFRHRPGGRTGSSPKGRLGPATWPVSRIPLWSLSWYPLRSPKSGQVPYGHLTVSPVPCSPLPSSDPCGDHPPVSVWADLSLALPDQPGPVPVGPSYLQARRDSNPQPPILETGALPVELLTYGVVFLVAVAPETRRAALPGIPVGGS